MNLNVNSTSRINYLNIDQTNHILKIRSNAERDTNSTHFELAEGYCQMAIFNARRYQGEKVAKTDLLFIALRAIFELRIVQR